MDRSGYGGQARGVRFVVRHHSRYQYDVPVELGPHTLRLTPRAWNATVLRRELSIEPQPAQRWEESDTWGNTLTRATFFGSTTQLNVLSTCEVETTTPPPMPQGLSRLPWIGCAPWDVDRDVVAFAHAVVSGVNGDPRGFLERLCVDIYERIARHSRLEGEARSAAQTLRSGVGACRDVAVLYLEACRAVGLPGYFVGGYQAHAATRQAQRQLHAWAEIALPGGYRCAWDPTHGTAVGEEHLALCAAPTQRETMPIEGGFTFIGGTVNSTLSYQVDITTGATD